MKISPAFIEQIEQIKRDNTAFFKGAYEHLSWKGKLAVMVFVVLLPIFVFNKLFIAPAMREKQVIHCKAVIAGKKAEAWDGEKADFCPALIKKHGATT